MSVPKHLTQDEWDIIKMGYETTVPNWLMRKKNISPVGKLFGGFLHSITYGDGWMKLEIEFIEELSGMDYDDIIDGWSELAKHNLIEQDIYSRVQCVRLRRG